MSDKGAITKLSSYLLDLVYPPGIYCICCGKVTDESRTYSMCNECMASIKWIGPKHCVKCGKALGENDSAEMCYNCKENAHSFDKGYSCAEYGLHEKTILYQLKYSSRGDIGRILGEICCDRMVAELGREGLRNRYDFVIPVPIYRKRMLRRGFNQSEIIASSFASAAGIKCENEFLVRNKETRPMKGLGPEERKRNIKGAFSIREYKKECLRGSSLLVIDDIYTTGATADEIAKVLKADGGASGVDVLSFASGADIIA